MRVWAVTTSESLTLPSTFATGLVLFQVIFCLRLSSGRAITIIYLPQSPLVQPSVAVIKVPVQVPESLISSNPLPYFGRYWTVLVGVTWVMSVPFLELLSLDGTGAVTASSPTSRDYRRSAHTTSHERLLMECVMSCSAYREVL